MTTHDSAADRRQFLAALTLAAAAPSAAFGKTAGFPALHALAARYVADKSVANVVVAIGGRKGPPTFISSGTLELGAGAKAGPDSLYRIYSMSKCIAGCAIMMLIEEGKLTLDTPLSAIFPGYAQMKVLTDPQNSLATKPANNQIKIRHIVTHSAGFAYLSNAPAPLKKFYEDLQINPGRSAPEVEARKPKTLLAFAELTAFAPLLFEPGTKWHYSIGLDIAGAVVEKLSGIAYEDFLAQRIFAPLGMVDTSFTVPANKLDRLATLYQGDDKGGLAVLDPGKTSSWANKPTFPAGGGGLVSSARDYSKFMAMLLGEGQSGKVRIMKPETAKVMMSNIMEPGVIATPTSGPTGYGAGGRSVITATPGGEQVGTYGWSGAANSHAFVDRASGVYAVLMTQRLTWLDSKLLPDLDKALYSDLA